MLEFLDTNPVVRYLVRDHVEFATRAEALIDSVWTFDRRFPDQDVERREP